MAFVKIPKDPSITKIENILSEIGDLPLSEARWVLLTVEEFITEMEDYAEIEDDLIPTPQPFNLTKAQAVRLLDRLYLTFINANGLDDKSPDFRTLIDENVRATHPPSAVKAGKIRGNTRKWGCTPHISQPRGSNNSLFFRESDLIDWFNLRYVPVLIKASA
jgi:hypothetical protein